MLFTVICFPSLYYFIPVHCISFKRKSAFIHQKDIFVSLIPYAKNKTRRFKMNASDICLPFKKKKRSPCLKTRFPREAVDTSSERCYLEQIKQNKKLLVLTVPHMGLNSTFKHFCTTLWRPFMLCCPGLSTWAQALGAAVLPCCQEPLLLAAAPASKGCWEVVSCLMAWLILEYLGINLGGQNFRVATSREDSLHQE